MTPWNHILLNSLSYSVPPVLVSIMSHAGSVPRTAGARMLLDGKGALVGTVGGGRYEALAIAAAKTMQQAWQRPPEGAVPSGNARVLHFSLRDISDMDMVCGGELSLLLEILPDTPDLRRVLTLAAQAEEAGALHTLVTRLTGHESFGVPAAPPAEGATSEGAPAAGQGSDQLLTAVRYIVYSGPSGSAQAAGGREPLLQPVLSAALGLTGTAPHTMVTPEGTFLLEPFPGPHSLHIFGGGHVAAALANLAHSLRFRVTVLEDRPEFLTPERFPFARRHLLADLGQEAAAAYLAGIPLDATHAIAIITRGHAYDRETLAAGLPTRAGYIGMIGSRNKWRQVRETLRQSGATEEALDQVRTPIGLPIGADTPEEIAVSIAAELIAWRNGKLEARRYPKAPSP